MKKNLAFVPLAIFMLLTSVILRAQDADCPSTIQDLKVLSRTDMENVWKSVMADAGFKNLYKEVSKKGFTRAKETKEVGNAYGFICKTQMGKEIVKGEFYTFDFISNDGKQACSMIWQKKGNVTYKAYVLLAKGQKDFFDSFDMGDEWYADEKGDIQLAHSFKKCFKRCVLKHCPGWCVGAMAGCGIAAASLLETGPGAAAFFMACAGSFCATCMAVCALGC